MSVQAERLTSDTRVGVPAESLNEQEYFFFLEHTTSESAQRFGEVVDAKPLQGERVDQQEQFGVTYLGVEGAGCDVAWPAGKGVVAIDVCTEVDGRPVRYSLTQRETPDSPMASVFEGNVPLKPGSRYQLRVWGTPAHVDHNRPIVDPYAKYIDGDVRYENGVQILPECVVIDETQDAFDWAGLERPRRPREYGDGEEVILECHVDAATKYFSEIPEELRGTYAGLGHEAYIKYLVEQGITQVELMPVQQYVANEAFLHDMGKSNAWGYNTLGFFAPHQAYAYNKDPQAMLNEFKTMVKNLHAAGIGVVMDVVYNHTAEGSDSRSSMLFNGLGLTDFYHHGDSYSFSNPTGCGNCTNTSNEMTADFILKSIDYWAAEMGVDGFRFDLAMSLAREGYNASNVNPQGVFMQRLRNKIDDLSAGLKKNVSFILEPWDANGFQPQEFSSVGSVWNAPGRDTMRKFALGWATVKEVATLLTGSIKPLENAERLPVNFITAHDGFTVADTVSYRGKRNQENGLNNTDGTDDNISAPHGWVEGPTDNRNILNRRLRAVRGMLSLLTLSRGTPMMLYGDSHLRTQYGNNNAFCQPKLIRDKWEQSEESRHVADYVRGSLRYRAQTGAITRTKPYRDAPVRLAAENDLLWLTGDGRPMRDEDWDHHTLAGMYRSNLDLDINEGGGPVLTYFNTSLTDLRAKIPESHPYSGDYVVALNSADGFINVDEPVRVIAEPNGIRLERKVVHSGEEVDVEGTSVVALTRVSSDLKNARATRNIRAWAIGTHIGELLETDIEERIAA